MNNSILKFDGDEDERERREVQAKFYNANENNKNSLSDRSSNISSDNSGGISSCSGRDFGKQCVYQQADGFDHEDDGFMIKQSLQIINIWEKSYSNPRLQLDITRNHIVSRQDHYEINPVVITRCFSYSCCISFIVQYSRKLNNEFSFGIMDMDKYAYDYNLSDAIGKLPHTWGVSEDTTSIARFRLQGKSIKKLPIVRNNDRISICFDLNSPNRYGGKCYFLINDRLISCIDDLTCDSNYGIAAIVPPQYTLEIIPNRVVDAEILKHTDEVYDTKMEDEGNAEDGDKNENYSVSDSKSTDIDQTNMSGSSSKTVDYRRDLESKPTPVPAFFPSSKNVLAPPSSNIISSTNSSNTQSAGLDCCICLSANKTVLFFPCKHICACEECGIIRTPPLTHCPVCREFIKSKTKVYL